MGERGPAPTPTAILKRRGSRCRNAAHSEPQPETTRPTCPRWLNKTAKAAWRQLVPLLETQGTLARIDGNALARYCVLWARWVQAEQVIESKGSTYPLLDEAGNVRCIQQRPEIAIANRLAAVLGKLESEFGMTPSARTRISVPAPAKDASPKAKFFKPRIAG